MKIDGINLEEYFRYHPLQTEQRINNHNKVNEEALEFARVIFSCVKNERLRNNALDAIQQARMFANQGITVDSLGE